MGTTRRKLLSGAAALAAAACAPAQDGGGGLSDGYFRSLGAALKAAGLGEPTLVIDRDRLDANIDVVARALGPTGLALRLVTKSLQSPDLLGRVMTRAGARRLMVFNSVMLEAVASGWPGADLLLGRPMAPALAARFIGRPGLDPQWLIDTPARLADYAAIARARGARLRVSLEIDVGLHRGGARDVTELGRLAKAALDAGAEITGLMGYDAQVAAVPFRTAELAKSRRLYAQARRTLEAICGPGEGRVYNTAGSPTYALHLDDRTANEVAVGSGFLKPAHFDLDTLERHTPAVFIAAPVIKRVEPALIPDLEALAPLLAHLPSEGAAGFFSYGYGDGPIVSPREVRFSRLYGDRAMFTAPRRVPLEPGDFIFLRPLESEGTLLAYGSVAVFSGGRISEVWPVFPAAA